jgi:hypothetical protein
VAALREEDSSVAVVAGEAPWSPRVSLAPGTQRRLLSINAIVARVAGGGGGAPASSPERRVRLYAKAATRPANGRRSPFRASRGPLPAFLAPGAREPQD